MNIMRQRDALKECRAKKIITLFQLSKALSCPVFQWCGGTRNLTPEQSEFIMQHCLVPVKSGGMLFPEHPPFDCFRISYTDVDIVEQWWIDKTDALCLRFDTSFSSPGVNMISLHHLSKQRAKVSLYIWINNIPLNPYTGKAGNLKMAGGEKELNEFANAPYEWLGYFLMDIMTPSNVVLKVEPKPSAEPRSVEWKLARTHYLILNRKQAQQIRESKGEVTSAHMERAAHYRRAHLRKLMSPKFTHKQGQIVRVKQAWIGPEEWTGLDGKIYRVQNLPEK